MQDLRYAARGLARNPLFAVSAIFAAALGIGSTTAVFSVVDRILFRSLPYPNGDRLVSVGMMAPLDTNEFLLSGNYLDFRRYQTPFESITSFTAGVAGCDLAGANPIRLGCAQVEGNFLPALGLAPLLGRNFTPAEDRPNAPKVALISYALWRDRFGADPQIPGKVVSIDGQPVTIIGVLPASFELPTLTAADVLIPQALNNNPNSMRFLRVFARLKPGVTIQQARAALQPIFDRALLTVPAAFRKEVSLRVRSLRDRQVHDARIASWVLLGAVIAVLLIACANIANLLLARSMNRRKELAVRAALGASRARLARQALTESALLAIAGGTAGCALAWALLRVFIGIAPSSIPHMEQASLDPRALLFAIAVSIASGLFFGLAPALPKSRRRIPHRNTIGRRSPYAATRIPRRRADRRIAGAPDQCGHALAQPLEARKRAAGPRFRTRYHGRIHARQATLFRHRPPVSILRRIGIPDPLNPRRHRCRYLRFSASFRRNSGTAARGNPSGRSATAGGGNRRYGRLAFRNPRLLRCPRHPHRPRTRLHRTRPRTWRRARHSE